MLRKVKKTASLVEKESRFGYIFILPWFIGFVFIFLRPLLISIQMTFSKITITNHGYDMEFKGLENYIQIITRESEFVQKVFGSIMSILYQLPVVAFLSLFIAVIINQKFRGRYLARAIFFLPVIVASGPVIDMLRTTLQVQQLGGSDSGTIYKSVVLVDTLLSAGFPAQLVTAVSGAVNQTFDITWKCGIQILLYLAGLQSIGPQYYEAADVEGATGWEKFWKITFPLISPITLIVLFYTVIDSFLDFSNDVMKTIFYAANNLQFERSTTMAVTYFVLVFGLSALLLRLVSKKVFYYD